MAGALTVEATEPVTAHTEAAAITTTVTDITSQPCGRAKRTGRSSSSGDWSLARACWRNCTGLPSPANSASSVDSASSTDSADSANSANEKGPARVSRPHYGTQESRNRRFAAPGRVDHKTVIRSRRMRSEAGDQAGDRGGVQ